MNIGVVGVFWVGDLPWTDLASGLGEGINFGHLGKLNVLLMANIWIKSTWVITETQTKHP